MVIVNVGEQGELQGLHDVTDAHSVVLLVEALANSRGKFGKLLKADHLSNDLFP